MTLDLPLTPRTEATVPPCPPPALRCQRWTGRRDRYRPAGERIDPSRYGVEVLHDDATPRAFVVANHYSGSFPAARRCVGLFHMRDLVGVAVFSVSQQPAALPRWTGTSDGVELGRFVLLDGVPGNGETWFLARAFRALRAELPEVRAVLSYSDPLERCAIDGRVVTPGHVGTIYQAHNGRYLGRARADTVVLDCDGRTVGRRGLSKLRNGERGGEAVYRRLLAVGAPERRPMESWSEYVTRAIETGPFRRVRHPGNHVYAWALDQDCDGFAPARRYPCSCPTCRRT